MPAESPLVCRLDAFNREQRERYAALIAELKSFLQEIQELVDGYALRFPADPVLFLRLAEWVTLERACCPFLDFELKVERASGPAWLRLTGGEGVKEFLKNQVPIATAAK